MVDYADMDMDVAEVPVAVCAEPQRQVVLLPPALPRGTWRMVVSRIRLDLFFNLLQLSACAVYSTFDVVIKIGTCAIIAALMGGVVRGAIIVRHNKRENS